MLFILTTACCSINHHLSVLSICIYYSDDSLGIITLHIHVIFKLKMATLLNGCKSDYFDIYQGVAQGCTLSPTLFLIFIDGLMKEIERTVPSLPSLEFNGLLFADDFVGLSDSEQGLQALIDVVYAYSKKWRFEANVAKCAVVVFRNEKEFRWHMDLG